MEQLPPPLLALFAANLQQQLGTHTPQRHYRINIDHHHNTGSIPIADWTARQKTEQKRERTHCDAAAGAGA